MSRVDIEIVGPKVVDSIDFDVFPTFAEPAVTTQAFTMVYFVEGAMNPDQKDVEWPQQLGERRSPVLNLDDVLDNQVVASRSERGDATMKTIEEARSKVAPPKKRSVRLSSLGQTNRKHVGCYVQEGLVQHPL